MLCVICSRYSPKKYFIKYENGYLCNTCNDLATLKYFSISAFKNTFHLLLPHMVTQPFMLWHQIEHDIFDSINKIQDTNTKKLYVNEYNTQCKFRHIMQYVVNKYFNTIYTPVDYDANIDLCNLCMLWHLFAYDGSIKYTKLSHNFKESTMKIIHEYSTSLETEEDIKIRLEDNYNEYIKIKERMDNFISCFHQIVDDELSTEEKFVNIFEFNANDIIKYTSFFYKIMNYIDSYCIDCKNDVTFFKIVVFKKTGHEYALKKDISPLSAIIKIFKHFHKLEDIAYNADINIKSVNDVKKTGIFSETCEYFNEY